jgi:hypothetical protein
VITTAIENSEAKTAAAKWVHSRSRARWKITI